MGNIFWRRRQPTEELDEIVKQLRNLESQVRGHLNRRADFMRMIIIGVVCLWGTASAYSWLLFRPISHRIAALAFSLIFSVLIFIALRLLCLTGYDFIIERKRRKIQYYGQRRIEIIEDVKENEKFKVAKEIIDKYGSETDLSKLYHPTTAIENMSPVRTQASDILSSDAFERRASTSDALATRGTQFNSSSRLPVTRPLEAATSGAKMSASSSALGPLSGSASVTAVDNTNSRAVLPKLHEMGVSNRHFSRTPIRPFIEPSGNPLDRILDYIMGESINNRYALVCCSCNAHNGMALREEFEQVSYFCFKCGKYNPSRNEMRATADGIQRRNSAGGTSGLSSRHLRSRPSPLSPSVRRPASFDPRTSRFSGPSRTPSIRSLAAITGCNNDSELENESCNSSENDTSAAAANSRNENKGGINDKSKNEEDGANSNAEQDVGTSATIKQ